MSKALAILEAEESPKGFMRLLSRQTFDEFLRERGFQLNHHNWWLKKLPEGPSQLFGIFWIEYIQYSKTDTAIRWLKVKFHLARPDRTIWNTMDTTKTEMPEEPEYQAKIRFAVSNLVRDVEIALRRSPERQLGASDTDESRTRVQVNVANAFWDFEMAWQKMLDLAANQPI